ncbi:hypothetical protein BVC80_8923g13 [Macleaya cordata]|uniref:Uncharacterized protein n=1 Tax=Macleaya cordata TaxID=56857 RepID=A0A200PVH1_MACCD|nr:hypothetical protein BVC80_8923g13 [Macleaya cordata]
MVLQVRLPVYEGVEGRQQQSYFGFTSSQSYPWQGGSFSISAFCSKRPSLHTQPQDEQRLVHRPIPAPVISVFSFTY